MIVKFNVFKLAAKITGKVLTSVITSNQVENEHTINRHKIVLVAEHEIFHFMRDKLTSQALKYSSLEKGCPTKAYKHNATMSKGINNA